MQSTPLTANYWQISKMENKTRYAPEDRKFVASMHKWFFDHPLLGSMSSQEYTTKHT